MKSAESVPITPNSGPTRSPNGTAFRTGGSPSLPGVRHQAAQRLEDRVHPLARLAGAEAADRQVDDARVDLGAVLVPDADPVGRAGAEVLDHDVGAADEVVEDLARLGPLEVERHAELVAAALEHRDRHVVCVLARQVQPARRRRRARCCATESPPAGFSTLITVAPSAPRSWVAYGPASAIVRSTTVIPSSGRGSSGHRRHYLRLPEPNGVGLRPMVEHSERVRVGWIDTDAGGRIHFTVAFRWAEMAETGLYRKLGLLDEWTRRLPAPARRGRLPARARVRRRGRGAHPRRRRSDGRRSRYTWEGIHDGEIAITGAHTIVHVDDERPAGPDRRPDARRCSPSERVSRNLILSRRGGRDGRLGSQHRLAAAQADQVPDASARVRRGAGAVPGRSGRRRPRRLLGRARPRPARRGGARHAHVQQRRPVLQHPAAAARVRPARAHASTAGCSTRTSRASGWRRSRRRSGASRPR